MFGSHRRRNQGRRPEDDAQLPRACSDGGQRSFTVQEALSLLTNPTARFALLELRRVDDSITRRQLIRRAVAHRHGRDPTNVSPTAVERALIDFHHITLPSLRSSGLVSVDGDTVELVVEPAVLRELLDIIERIESDASGP